MVLSDENWILVLLLERFGMLMMSLEPSAIPRMIVFMAPAW